MRFACINVIYISQNARVSPNTIREILVQATQQTTSLPKNLPSLLPDALLYPSSTVVRKNNATTWELAGSSKRTIDFPLVSVVPVTNTAV